MEVGLHDAAPRYLADLCVPAASTDGRRQSRSAVSSWCSPGLGRLLASAALLRMAPGPGTDYQRHSDHQNGRSLHSSASSRPTRLFQHWTVLAAAVGVVYRRPIGAVVIVQRVRRRLQMSRLDSG